MQSAPTPEARKEIKVRIPVSLYIKLHALKLLGKGEIGDIVTAALEAHLRGLGVELRITEDDDESPGLPDRGQG